MDGALSVGRPWPMGVHWDGSGVNIAVFSVHAQAIDLCVFDTSGTHETARLRLPGRTGDVWHGRLEGAAPGLVYGLRAHGPWRECLNTVSMHYGGSNVGTPLGMATSENVACHGRAQSIVIDLPPLATVMFEWTAS